MARFTSRKFLVAVFSLALVVFHDFVGLDFDMQEIIGIAALAASYIGGEAWVDKQKVREAAQQEVVFWRDLASTASDAYTDLMAKFSPEENTPVEAPFGDPYVIEDRNPEFTPTGFDAGGTFDPTPES